MWLQSKMDSENRPAYCSPIVPGKLNLSHTKGKVTGNNTPENTQFDFCTCKSSPRLRQLDMQPQEIDCTDALSFVESRSRSIGIGANNVRQNCIRAESTHFGTTETSCHCPTTLYAAPPKITRAENSPITRGNPTKQRTNGQTNKETREPPSSAPATQRRTHYGVA